MKIVTKEFVFNGPLPTPENHASTIITFDHGDALASWFGGTKENNPDVVIWYSRRENGIWSKPEKIEDNQTVQHWNPVLYKTENNTVYLFYKMGAPIAQWKTMVTKSDDFGKSWTEPKELVENDVSGGRGPVKNKPILLSNGTLLAPASTEQGKWRCFVDIYDGKQWTKYHIPVKSEEEDAIQLIQPTVWESEKGSVHALLRSNMGKIYRSDSGDYGKTWSEAYPIHVPNNNSGIDCVMTDAGLVLVCNPVEKNWGARSPITVFLSTDNGMTFEKVFDLETQEGEYSYPAVIYEAGKLFITYTYNRKKIAFYEIALG